MPALGYVALVLHAHLPWARPVPSDEVGRRWLLEALWESYLPLWEILERFRREKLPAALTLSLSPTLACMLMEASLEAELNGHLDALDALNAKQRVRTQGGPFEPVVALYENRIQSARAAWRSMGGDLLQALEEHRRAGRLDLLTSSATHAYLPGLAHEPNAVRAQIRIGRRALATAWGDAPVGLWLPECAYDPRLGPVLASEGVGYTVVDEHGVQRGRPRPARGAASPVMTPRGVAFFGRDRLVAHQVWSRARGYPGDPAYRDFYRDVGFDLPASELGSLRAGSMTGLKYHRITSPNPQKLPYDPAAAQARLRQHADHFVQTCAARLGRPSARGEAPVVVAAFDAELFGHWWFEGPSFIERVLQRLTRSEELEAISLGAYLERHPRCPLVEPAASSWGEGGHGRVWVGREAAPLWRHIHAAHRKVAAAVRRYRHATGQAGEALDEAIRQLLLLQSSDWPFMIRGGDVASYARERFEEHRANVDRLLAELSGHGAVPPSAASSTPRPAASGFLRQLCGDQLRDVFAP